MAEKLCNLSKMGQVTDVDYLGTLTNVNDYCDTNNRYNAYLIKCTVGNTVTASQIITKRMSNDTLENVYTFYTYESSTINAVIKIGMYEGGRISLMAKTVTGWTSSTLKAIIYGIK